MKKVVLVLFFVIFCSSFCKEVIGNYFGTNISTFAFPISIKVDKNENIYLLDFIYEKMLCYDKEWKVKYVISDLKKPSFFTFINDKIYITESNENRIKIFEVLTGKQISTFGSYGMKEKEFKHPTGIYTNDNKIYIIDEGNFRLQILNMDNEYIGEILIPKFRKPYETIYGSSYYLLFNNMKMYCMNNFTKQVYSYEKGIVTGEAISIEAVKNPSAFFSYNDSIFIYDNLAKKLHCYDKGFFFKERYDIFKEDSSKNYNIINFFQPDVYSGMFYFTDNNKVYVYNFADKTTKVIKELSMVKYEDYIEPNEVATDNEKQIYLLDKKIGRILIFNKELELVRTIEQLGEKPTGFCIDEFKNVFVAVAGENRIKKYNKFGNFVLSFGGYEIFPECYENYYNNLEEDLKEKNKIYKELNGDKIYNFKIRVDNKGYLYILDGKNGSIRVYDSFFQFKSIIGKKTELISVVRKKIDKESFGWNEVQDNNINDIFEYKGKLFVVDSYYKRVQVFENGKYKASIVGNFSTGISSVFVKEDIIYISDAEQFKIIKYNMKYEKIGEISFLNEGLMPLFYYDDCVIGKVVHSNLSIEYKVIHLGEKNDKNKRTGSSAKRKENIKQGKSGN